jgi:dipeptidyl aminopeptidase/acylaminoacyl peptidase
MIRAALVLASLLGLSAPALAGLPPLIPRKVLFGNPVKTAPRLSPDGKRLAFLAPDRRDVMQVWVQTLGKDDARAVTFDRYRGIYAYQWTYAPDTLIFLQDNGGDENYHIFSVHLKSGVVRDLTPFVGVRAAPLAIHPKHPNELLVTLSLKNEQFHDVYRVDLTTGALVLDTRNPGDVVSWKVDPLFRVRVALASLPAGGTAIYYRHDVKAAWQRVIEWGHDDDEGQVLGFSGDGKSLWLFSSAGHDTLCLVKHHLESGKEEVLARDPHADATGFLMNPDTHEVEAVAFTAGRARWKAVAPGFQADLEALRQGNPGDPVVLSRDDGQKTWLVGYAGDTQPTTYFLYDRPTRTLTELFKAHPELDDYQLAPLKSVVIKSRDGMDLVGYLTLPVGVEPRKLPLVLLVHGGPWLRDSWGYHPQTQWLVNRGYAVLQVNFRGSTGFGKKFLHAGDREWGGKMQDDLIDAVRWAIKEGYADPRRIAICGASYGGYAALAGAAFTPDVFACAIDVDGPSNLVTMLKAFPPQWEGLRTRFRLRVGDVDKERDFLESRSPLFKAEQIRIPMLIAQGANDPRVKMSESEQIVAAIRRAGKHVEYLVFPDEGHGFVRAASRLRFATAAEQFLHRHLGGRVEPIREDGPKPFIP